MHSLKMPDALARFGVQGEFVTWLENHSAENRLLPIRRKIGHDVD